MIIMVIFVIVVMMLFLLFFVYILSPSVLRYNVIGLIPIITRSNYLVKRFSPRFF